MSSQAESAKGPLSGLTVIELASILAGPAVGMFLAELGARVIKIEPPSGDATRHWRMAGETNDISSYFSCVNWGKEFISLDLKNPDDFDLAHRLIGQADIVLSNFRPESAKRMQLSYEQLRSQFPQLIYAQISAYGLEDPRPGFDAVIQAESGFMSINGQADGPATKMPVALMDLLAAHQLKEGILLALLKREKHNTGSHVHVCLQDAAVASLANQASNYLSTGQIPGRKGSDHPNIVPYGTVFSCRDGKEVSLAVGTDPQFKSLCRALELPDLLDETRFDTNNLRVKHREKLMPVLSQCIANIESETLQQRLNNYSVPHGFIRRIDEVFADPNIASLKLHHEGLGAVRTVVFAKNQTLRPPQHLDADRDAITN